MLSARPRALTRARDTARARSALVVGLCALAVICVLSGSAAAAPVTWTLDGVAFDDGGTASGSFVYDAATNTYSAISITTTAGSSRPGASYAFACTPPCAGLQPTADAILFLTTSSASDQSGLPGFALHFRTGDLADQGKSAPISDGTEASCSDAACSDAAPPGRTVSGRVVSIAPGAPIPTLSEWGTILLVLFLLTVGSRHLARSRTRPPMPGVA